MMMNGSMKSRRESGAPAARFVDLVDWIKAYKELVVAAVAVAGAVFLVLDYFAKRTELEALECKFTAQTAILESRYQIDDATKKLVLLEQEMLKIKAAKPARSPEAETKLKFDIDRESARRAFGMKRETEAEDRLYNGDCDKQASRERRGTAAHKG